MPTVNRKSFADWVGYSPRQVGDWLDQGMPCTRSGKKGEPVEVETAAAIRWMLENVRLGRVTSDDRERLAAAQADKVEFENRVRRNEFIPIDQHGELLRKVVGEVAGQMSGFPGRVAGKIASIKDPAVVRATLIDECNEVRNAVAATLERIADSFDGDAQRISDGSDDSSGAAEDDA